MTRLNVLAEGTARSTPWHQ